MTRKRDESLTAEAARLYTSGMSLRAAGAELGRHEHTIRWRLGDTPRRPPGHPRRGDVSDDEILRLRDQDKLSWQAIAEETGMSKTGVRLRYAMLTGQGRPDRPKA